MLQRIFITLFFCFAGISAFTQSGLDDLCLSEAEMSVVQKINAFRQEHGLQPVPLSRSLTYVADVHAKDLYFFYNENSGGSMHSWSEKGRWKGCLYTNPKTDGRCMHNKPSELTSYQGLGFELVYWDNTGNEADNAFSTWVENSDNRKMLLNDGAYVTYDWNAMGVRIFKGYVIVWFGTITDEAAVLYECGAQPEISATASDVSSPAPKPQKLYYVVVASYHNHSDAQRDKVRWEKRFFEPLKLLENNGKYRLAVGAYNDNAAAEKALKMIQKQVKDAWIISL